MSKNDVLYIEGMGCTACANKIEKAVSSLEGVESAAVDFAYATLYVTYADTVSPTQIVAVIEDLGYQVQ